MNMQVSIANAIGADFIGKPNYITDSFINRVIADGGTFEAETCLANKLIDLAEISSDEAPFPFAEYLAATGITGPTQVAAIYNLMSGLKQDGLWSKMKAIYPFVTDNRNLFSYTEDFGNAYWAKNNSTIAANSTAAPNGTLTADTLTDNTTNNAHSIFGNVLPSTTGLITGSVYLKYNTRRYAVLSICTGSAGSIRYSAVVDLQTGTITQNNSLNSPTNTYSAIENVGNGWYRVSVGLNCTTTAAASNYVVIATSNTATPTTFLAGTLDPSYIGNGSSVFMWGAQVEIGSTATTYQPIATTQQAFISSQFKYNLVNPVDSDAAFRLVFNGGWTHSSNGATPNGTNGWANTYYNPSLNGQLNSAHLSYYSRTNNIVDNQIEMGANAPAHFLCYRFSSTLAFHGINSSDAPSTPFAPSTGLFLGSRIASTTGKFYTNGSLALTDNKVSSSRPNQNISLGALNNSGTNSFYTTKQTAFSTIGDGLTDTEAANLYTRVQAFQTSLSRQV